MATHSELHHLDNIDDLESTEAALDGIANPVAMYRTVVDTRAVNEQLVMSGLRAQELAEQLQRQLAFINAITDSLGEGVYALDNAGRITFVNPAAEQLLGWTKAEMLGRYAREVIHMQSTNQLRIIPQDTLLQAMIRSSITYHEDALLAHRSGNMFPVAFSAAPIDADGEIVGAVVAFRDMTEVRRLQQAQEEYLALISHDLRTPLTVILGRTEMLLQTLTRQGLEREARSAKIIVESSNRMNLMISSLMERSRLETGQNVLHLEPTELVQLTTRIVEQIDLPTDGKQIHLEGAAELPVVVDVAQIERVISNLVSNALKFSPPGSSVVVRVSCDNNRALVSVADHGSGIDPQALSHVFDKHYRVRKDVEGEGLGLYISRLIIEAHGGRLWAESEVNVGSLFTFALPIVPSSN